MGQPAHAVLEHDHAGVDDQAEVDRTQAHQAGRQAGGEHDVGREQHRQRNRQRDDQAAPQVPEHGQQHEDDQGASGQQIVQHGAERQVDQVGAVVKRFDRDARGKALLELGDLGLHIGHDLAAVLADEHHHQPGDDLTLAVPGGQAGPNHRRGMNLGNPADGHGHAVALVDHDGRDVVHRPCLADSPDVPGLALVDQVASAHVGVVVLQRVEHVGHR